MRNMLAFMSVLWTCEQRVRKIEVLWQFCGTRRYCCSHLRWHQSAHLLILWRLENHYHAKGWKRVAPRLHNVSDVTLVLQRSKREKEQKKCPCRLLHVVVIWICAELRVNGNNSGTFIFIRRGNRLIGITSAYVNVLSVWKKKSSLWRLKNNAHAAHQNLPCCLLTNEHNGKCV